MRKLNKKVITVVTLVLILTLGFVIGFLNFAASQSAKKEFASLCENFITKTPELIEKLSAADESDEIRVPKLALITSIKSYKNSLEQLSKYSGANETKIIITDAEKLLKNYLDLKDEQGNIEFRNPYRLEYEAYLDSLPLVAVRGLSDPAFQARFMAKALKVEAKYRSYNEDNFSGRPKLSSSKSFLTKKIGEANNLCKIARNIK